MAQDYAVAALAANDTVSVVAARTTGIVREAQARHGCSPTVTAALGRLLTGAVLMSVGLRGRERLTLRMSGDGPAGGLVADASPGGRVRGYPQRPRAEVPLNRLGKFDVGGVIGSGTLHVTRIQNSGQPYSSAVPLVSGEVGEDLAFYFARSEQIPTVMALGVLASPQGVLAAGGVFAQLMPGADDNAIGVLETSCRALPQVSTLVRQGFSPEALVNELAAELSPRVTLLQPAAFRCPCDRSRVVRAIVGVGTEELAAMANSCEDTEVTCDYCGQRYYFSPYEVKQILENASARAEG